MASTFIDRKLTLELGNAMLDDHYVSSEIDVPAGQYVMLVKTFKGLTDRMLEWQTRELLARETGRDSMTVYVRPELVVEIAFSDLQSSPRYPGGLALRLARVKSFRTDKGADQADTMESVRRIVAAQRGR